MNEDALASEAKGVVTWTGPVPVRCQICKVNVIQKGQFIDGRTKQGPWALMCHSCHKDHGCGLGVGRGQHYAYRDSVGYVKIAG